MAAKKPAKTEKAAPVTGAQEEKLKALEHALADLDKQIGTISSSLGQCGR